MAYNLRGIAMKMTKYFDMMLKYSGEVVKYETEARSIAKNMEEASMKASISRRRMFNVLRFKINLDF